MAAEPKQEAPAKGSGASSASSAPKVSFKLKHRVEQAEKTMEQVRSQLELLDRELGSPDAYAHPADAQAKLKRRNDLQAKMDAAEAEWLAALEAIEGG